MNSNKNKNKDKNKKKYNKPCLWDCKLGLALFVGFLGTIMYFFTIYSKRYQLVKKRGKYIPGDLNYFRGTYYWFFIISMGSSILVIKGIKYILKLL